MGTNSEKESTERRYILGSAYINDITVADEKLGERFSSSLKREELEKLEESDRGEVKISYILNEHKRDGKKDPDLTIIPPGVHSDKVIANIYLNKKELLKQEGDEYVKFFVSDKNPENLVSEKARNMVAFSDTQDKDGKREVIGSGWRENVNPPAEQKQKKQSVSV